MEALFFNVSGGFLEGVLRGYKAGLLTQSHYANLTQCESLEDFRMQLAATDYGNFLANEPLPISTSTIAEKATQVLVDQFNYLRNNAVEPLSKETRTNCCKDVIPGVFDTMPALCVATTVEELYQTVLVETPLAPYFRDCLSASDLDDLNIEIIRNTLYKAYLEDFHAFTQTIGGPTAEVMDRILSFEADRRTINITINSFGTDLSKEQRAKLFPTIGRLFPAGNNQLAKADEVEAVKAVCDYVPQYRSFFEPGTGGRADDDGAASLEDSYIKLKEQEIRSITWIAECIAQDARDRIQDFIPTF
ncbi:V-type proton ATPase subunit [Rhizoctonia solani]|uniref:V-type proton ATPase subunit n=1 Tax=Rhizoctonia solani TaxID=456999 RepID=A0A8H7I306_9AGAM|nr:V-type proton ATPase subunit [Rhizoctonia solani]